jgi:hypothetical protein
MLDAFASSGTSPTQPTIPVFEGFPYLVIRVMNDLVNVSILPDTLSNSDYEDLIRRQVDANNLEACLAFSEDHALYVSRSGHERHTTVVPRGAVPVIHRLRLPRLFPLTAELETRLKSLEAYVKAHTPTGYLLGDITKGGRRGTADEIAALRGTQSDGTPQGLMRCVICHDWRGTCLDPDPQWDGLVMTVECQCANDNRCAWCQRPLAPWKLNSNYYNEGDRTIWHVPTFSGLSHTCGTSATQR